MLPSRMHPHHHHQNCLHHHLRQLTEAGLEVHLGQGGKGLRLYRQTGLCVHPRHRSWIQLWKEVVVVVAAKVVVQLLGAMWRIMVQGNNRCVGELSQQVAGLVMHVEQED